MADVYYQVAKKLVEELIARYLEWLADEAEKQAIAWPSSDGFTVESGERCIVEVVKASLALYTSPTTSGSMRGCEAFLQSRIVSRSAGMGAE